MFKTIDRERLCRYDTAKLAAASGISIRAINAAKKTGTVRYRTWHALVSGMSMIKPFPNGATTPPPSRHDPGTGRFRRAED